MREGGDVAHGLEDAHRPLGAVLGGVGLPGHEEVAREAHEALAERDRLVEALVDADRLAPGRDRLAEAVGVVELPAVVVEHRRPLGRGEPLDVPDDRLEVSERLAVRPGAGRLAGRRRTDREQRVDVAGRDRVVHQAGALRRDVRPQRVDDRLVEQLAADRRQALLDRAPRELVAEAQALGPRLDHPRELGGLERAGGRAEQHPREVGRDV